MHCPFLTGNYMLYCTTLRQVYIPSIYELEEYCKSGRHSICPFYMKSDQKRGNVRREAAPFGVGSERTEE